MEKKVVILSIKKNEIVIKVRKKRNLFFLAPMIIIVFMIGFFANIPVFNSVKNSMIQVFNPVSSLYNDNSDIVFTGSGLYEKDSLNFNLPIKAATWNILSDGTIEFVVGKSIMITACESGIVSEVGTTNDNIKYITIRHSSDIISTIENVEIVGVTKGDIVKSGQDIATAKTDSKVNLKLFQSGSQLNNFKIVKSKIVWEN